MGVDPTVLEALGADAPNGVGAFEASGGYPDALGLGTTDADVPAFDASAPAPAALKENGCGALEVVGG